MVLLQRLLCDICQGQILIVRNEIECSHHSVRAPGRRNFVKMLKNAAPLENYFNVLLILGLYTP